MTNSNNKTSLLVKKQLPAFVREEHETFVKFLEYYYKFLEQEGQMLYVSKNFLPYLDIDIITQHIYDQHIPGGVREYLDYHGFLQKLYDSYIGLIPDSILIDKSLLVKHAKEFYRSRGTEKSVRFLMRALFNKEVDFYYPKTDILRASDGKWFIERSLKITDIRVNNVSNSIAISNFTNKQIRGSVTGATALVESVDVYFDKGELIYELKLSSIYRQFQDPETIYCFFTEEGTDKYLSANLFSGVITAVTINQGGSGYVEGATIPINTSTGSGAQLVISRVTKGTIQAVGVVKGGAGFKVNDPLVFSGSGFGATGIVSTVNTDGVIHPNSYNVMWSTINLEASTQIGNLTYSNLNSKIINPAIDSSGIANSMSFFVYGDCGPAVACVVANGGNNYVPPISISISANSVISKLGILGGMGVVNPGTGYANGDLITFTNLPGSTGSGALGYVNVNATGAIVTARFKPVTGQITGGSGYDWFNLPLANVVSGTGSGGNVIVTAVIGQNEELIQSLSNIGVIQGVTIISGGSNYSETDTVNLSTSGDGQANISISVITGAFSYPGRYINDDGHLSGYNFLEDRDYYQEFSYVVKIDETINKYRRTVKDLVHPAGTKLFGEYVKIFDTETLVNTNVSVTYANTETDTLAYETLYQIQDYMIGTLAPDILVGNANAETVITSFTMNTSNHLTQFVAQNNSIIIGPYTNNNFSANDKIFLWFQTNASSNIENTNYTVRSSNGDYLFITNPLTETPTGNVGNVRVFNPDITIRMPYSVPQNGTNIYLQWANSLTNVDTSLANGFYSVYDSGVASFNICHPSMITSTSSSNTVNVITKKVQISTVGIHEYNVGDQVYLLFLGGDTANTSNGYYTVTQVENSASFNIAYQNTILSGSGARVYKRRSKIIVSGTNTFANGNTIYVSYTSGDQANTTNGVYSAIKIASDTLTLNTAKPLSTNSAVRIWSSQNNYSNIKFTTLRSGQIFNSTDNVYIEFFTSTQDLANGIYDINTVYGSSNSFNIAYNANTYTKYVSVTRGQMYQDTVVFAPTSGSGKEFQLSNVASITINQPGVNVKAGYVTFAGGSGVNANAYVEVANSIVLFANSNANILRITTGSRFTLAQANLVNGTQFVIRSIANTGTINIATGVTYNVRNATANTFQVRNVITGNVESLANVQNVVISTSNTENISYVYKVTLSNPGYGFLPGESVSATAFGSNTNATFTVVLQNDGNTVFKNVAYSGAGVIPLSRMEGTALVSLYK